MGTPGRDSRPRSRVRRSGSRAGSRRTRAAWRGRRSAGRDRRPAPRRRRSSRRSARRRRDCTRRRGGVRKRLVCHRSRSLRRRHGDDPATQNHRTQECLSGARGAAPAHRRDRSPEQRRLRGQRSLTRLARSTAPWVDLISPSNNHDLYSIEDLAQLIDELKTANPNARVSVKIPVVPGVGIIAVGIAKAGADAPGLVKRKRASSATTPAADATRGLMSSSTIAGTSTRSCDTFMSTATTASTSTGGTLR